MNYRHAYHAGNFADVIKHVILIAIFQALKRKEAPFCFLDTHAGIGLYELQSVEAQKKQEYSNGIAKLLSTDQSDFPQLLQDYIQIIKKYNSDNSLDFYPGSPFIASDLVRKDDQIILCELHPEDNRTLKSNLKMVENVAIHHMDGYLGMKAFLPPKQKRGFVLIDPPFEVINEFEHIFQAIQRALKHWRSGHIMVWYPIKDHDAVNAFYDDINELNVENCILHFSLENRVEAGKLFSCGILLINPPFQVKETIETILPVLSKALQTQWEFVVA